MEVVQFERQIMKKKLYARPELTKLGLLRLVTKFSF